jgi:hypothetical protein
MKVNFNIINDDHDDHDGHDDVHVHSNASVEEAVDNTS